MIDEVAKLLLALVLALGAHFAMTFNVPTQPGKAWLGWPFAVGDAGWSGGVIGRSGAHAPYGALLAALAAGGFVMAILSVFALWVPQGWWPLLAAVAAVWSLALMALFFKANKVLAIAVDLIVIATAVAAVT